MSDQTRPAPPPLVVPDPPRCSVCRIDVDSTGDGFRCSDCDAFWSYETDQDGEWTHPGDQCPEESRPHEDNSFVPERNENKHRVYRCLRTVGHAGGHANPEMISWVKGWM